MTKPTLEPVKCGKCGAVFNELLATVFRVLHAAQNSEFSPKN